MRKFFKYLFENFFETSIQDFLFLNCFHHNLSKDEIEYLNKKIDELFDKNSLK